MITNPQEYWKLLYLIQDKNTEFVERPLPLSEPRYNIDLNSRLIEAPEYVGAEKEVYAETIYFRCPRYFENMDLTLTTCIIMYKNAKGDERVYPVPFYDAVTEEADGNILIPWILSGDVTSSPGTVEFAIRFYTIDGDNQEFVYCLNTQSATTKVLASMETTESEDFDYSANFTEAILDRLARLEKDYNLYWLEVK